MFIHAINNLFAYWHSYMHHVQHNPAYVIPLVMIIILFSRKNT